MQHERDRADSFQAYSCGTKGGMSAEILKRKIRNFPVANLNERIATSS